MWTEDKGRIAPLAAPPKPGDGSGEHCRLVALGRWKHTACAVQLSLPNSHPCCPAAAHGAFYWDQSTTQLTVKLTGGRSLEVRRPGFCPAPAPIRRHAAPPPTLAPRAIYTPWLCHAPQVRTENAIDISQTLAISIDQFYSIQKNFYLKVAYLLGIEPERFRCGHTLQTHLSCTDGSHRQVATR